MAGAIKEGPWGGKGNETSQDMGIANHIISVKIYYIDAVAAVQALDVVYTLGDYGGKQETFHMGGTIIGDTPVELELAEDEYFVKISGQFHNMWNENEFVTQLTLVTNKGNSVSAGKDQSGAAFSFDAEKGGKIVGFFGLEGKPTDAVEAIGVYYLPPAAAA